MTEANQTIVYEQPLNELSLSMFASGAIFGQVDHQMKENNYSQHA